MTASDWEGVCFVLAKAWPGEFTADHEAAYFFIVGDYERQAVEAAIKQLARAGGRFRPSAAEIAAAVEGASLPPSFDEAWPVIDAAARRFYADPDRLLTEIRERAGEFAAGWVATYSVERLTREPLYGEHGGAVLHRLAASYAESSSTEEKRARVVLALTEGGLRLNKGLRHPDFLAGLSGPSLLITTGSGVVSDGDGD